jgi:negative regulator of sigma-B (phosphoserine phosphatase)
MGALIEAGLAARNYPGQSVSGDRSLVQPFPGGVLVAVVDGLGHGAPAAQAADIALASLRSHARETPEDMVQRCHQALKGTRGVVLSLASIDARDGTLAWLGVGNVDAMLLRLSGGPSSREALLTRSGVVGYQLPPLRPARLGIMPGDLLVFATDGLRSGYVAGLSPLDPLLRQQPAQAIAEDLLSGFGRANDDALVLVVRWRGEEGT